MEFVCHGKFPHTQQQQRKKSCGNGQKTHQEQWEVVERGCQAKPKGEKKKNKKTKQNGWLSCVGNIIEMDLFSLSFGYFFFYF